ncbi:MAG: SDR family oxidoreductase [Halieaceae bacterium]|jgi:NAD(P)-dependent dehydrogenase (short-subunit alcohol dehydrogenase family)|nr:SDR family oxidoreductase [Halieaceae bacterium]
MHTIMITGANRGIGLELLKQYAASGARVIATCRDPSSADEASALARAHDSVSLHALEVSDPEAVNALATQLLGSTVDVLILNAGMMGKDSTTLGELEADDFRRVLDVNVVAQAMCLQAFAPLVANSARGVIVGMGSFLGSLGCNSDGGHYSYRASKAGMHAIMRSAAHDLREQGTIAIVMHPGWVQTDMGGPNATITTEESVSGIRKVIDGLGAEDSGRLLTYSGDELPW